MPILYRSAVTPPPPPVNPPINPAPTTPPPAADPGLYVVMDVQWNGADGSQWYLTSPASRIRLMPGIRGLEAGDIQRWTSDAPGLAGNRYRGHRALAREVFLPVYVRGASSSDWVTLRRAWDASMDPDTEGTLVVTVQGARRYLPCRWVSTEAGWTRDPLLAGKNAMGEYFEAAGAYWQGEPITRSWVSANPDDFFMAVGGVFWISPSNTIGSAVIDNPGDVPAWPVWTVRGPFTTATIGITGADIDIPFALSAGQWLRIDTRPDRQSVVDHTGADRVADLGAVAFAPIPAGQSVTLAIDATVTGTGFGVEAALTPLYRRAW